MKFSVNQCGLHCGSLRAVSFLLLMGLNTPAASAEVRHEFWVAPDGSDSAPGTKAQPFQTLEKARDAARAVPSRYRGEIDIYLRGGQYRLENTLALGPEDSGRNGHDLVFRAAPGEHPVISGSVPVKNWSLFDPDLNIWQADAGGWRSRQLYVNGERAVRARTEPYPASFRPEPRNPANDGIQYLPNQTLNPYPWYDPGAWTNIKQIEAVIITQWKMMSVPLAAITPPHFDKEGDFVLGLITLQTPGWTNAGAFFDYDQLTKQYQPGLWSFWQVTRFENALEFLDAPGEWYLDESSDYLYYIPRWAEDMAAAAVELPVLDVLVKGQGGIGQPVSNIRFQGLTFSYATWMEPSGPNGYVSDQSGFHLVGGNQPNIIGHNQYDERTPGNVQFQYAHGIKFHHNRFEHLGAVALDFDTGSQHNEIINNYFNDISSAAIQVGGVNKQDHHPDSAAQITQDHLIADNLIYQVGREYVDAAGIFIGFTTRTRILHNTIIDVPWSGIAIGWGWGLVDPGSFPGCPGAQIGMWGLYDTPTTNRRNKIVHNRFESFLQVLWDGGAIYVNGQQGVSRDKGLLIAANVASGKRPAAGGNVFYTDAGSRYVTVRGNALFDNPVGRIDFGPCPKEGDLVSYSPIPCLANLIPYGGDIGGCRTYGDIRYEGNYWSSPDYFNICPFLDDQAVSYPVNISYRDNHVIEGESGIPHRLISAAGRRPHSHPAP